MDKNEVRDEVNIVSGFMRRIISGYVSRLLKKQIGLDADLKINDLHVYTFRGKVHFSVGAEGTFDQNDLTKLIGQ